MSDKAQRTARQRARQHQRKARFTDLRRLISSSPLAGRTRHGASWAWRAPIWLVTVLMALILVAVTALGAFRNAITKPAPPAVAPAATATASPSPSPIAQTPQMETAASNPDLAALQEQISAIEAHYNVKIGLAFTGVSPVGTQTTNMWAAGSLTTGPSLETIDIPIAVAVLNLPTQPNNLTYLLSKAISESSPGGDQALYSFLGNADDAAAKTNAVLRSYGDAQTSVATTTPRLDVPAFSQTNWTTVEQAHFAGQLWCSPQAGYAVSMMRFPATGHSYGFGQLAGSYVRTDDSTDDQGNPIIRQIAIVPNANGDRIGVSLFITGAHDKLDDAKAAADAVAGRVYLGTTGFQGAHC